MPDKEVLYKLFDIAIPPGAFVPVDTYASHLYVKQVSGDGLKVSIDNQDFAEIQAGIHLQMQAGGHYRRAKFWNNSGATITAKIALSSEILTDSSLVVGETVFVKTRTAAATYGAEKTVGTAAAVKILDDNTDRNALIVQAKDDNVGLVYIGFDDDVADDKWVAELQPGMSFSPRDYRGAVYAIASEADQVVGWGQW